MAIQAGLKRKLKASDRRRRRRASATAEAPLPNRSESHTHGDSVGPDVVGLIVQALVQIAANDGDVLDGAAIAGLRGNLNGIQPTGSHSNLVFDRVQEISQRDDVSKHAIRSAIKSLLEIASKHQSNETDPKSFLSYLAILAE